MIVSDLKLSPRLLAVAQLVRSGARFVDVGTDHAYLAAHLVLSGRAAAGIAADVTVGPLKNAQATIQKHALADKVQCRLSNGLSAVAENEADDIIIAGMGGELIMSIIDECNWLKNSAKHLVLQPMTHSEKLRSYLYTNGFDIINETVIAEKNRAYNVLLARHDGVLKTKALLDCYTGAIGDFSTNAAKIYLRHSIKYLTNKNKAQASDERTKTIEGLKKLL